MGVCSPANYNTVMKSPNETKHYDFHFYVFFVCKDNLYRILLDFYAKFWYTYTVKLRCLEHLWDPGNSFETWVVRATEG